jgi:hypothetical protein
MNMHTAIDGRAEKVSAESVPWEGGEDISVRPSTEGQRRYQWRDQHTAIDGKAEKVSAESVRWEGKEEWATIVD